MVKDEFKTVANTLRGIADDVENISTKQYIGAAECIKIINDKLLFEMSKMRVCASCGEINTHSRYCKDCSR